VPGAFQPPLYPAEAKHTASSQKKSKQKQQLTVTRRAVQAMHLYDFIFT